MKEKIEALEREFAIELRSAKTTQDLEALRVRFLGKKGPVTALMKDLKEVALDEKPHVGKWINECRDGITQRLESSLERHKKQELLLQMDKERLDISLPGIERFIGRFHPISQMIEQMLTILKGMGFSVYKAPEIESDYYNYGGLNYPEDHPARDMQDTFYLDAKTLLRSHTTNFQQRVMEKYSPPLRICSPGKCYRNETISARSHVLFHQIDVMYIDTKTSFADLLATLEEFYSKVFEEKVEIRVRSSYFPFVEPGVEVDVRCTLCKGKGCSLCKHSGWLEVCGAGMIHPEVLKAGGVDPETTSGFAWGGGIERVYLLRYGINDIRLFLENDMRFLEQFP